MSEAVNCSKSDQNQNAMMSQKGSFISYLCAGAAFAGRRNVTFCSNKSSFDNRKGVIIETITRTRTSSIMGTATTEARTLCTGNTYAFLRGEDKMQKYACNANNFCCNHLRKSFSSVTVSLCSNPKTTTGEKDVKAKVRKKKKEVSASPPSSKTTSPLALTKAQRIKKLHKENKELFGELLESKQEKVKRIKAETKGNRPMIKKNNAPKEITFEQDDAFLLTIEDARNNSDKVVRKRRSLYNPVIFPRAHSVQLEHASVSINKNRMKHDADTIQEERKRTVAPHKEAEIEWVFSQDPTKMKLIELSSLSSSLSTEYHDRDDVVADNNGKGHLSTPLPPPQGSGSSSLKSNLPETSSPLRHNREYLNPDSSSLPTVEQLINSFYETDDGRDGQLRPKSETRKIPTSEATEDSSSVDQDRPHYYGSKEDEPIHGGKNREPVEPRISVDDPILLSMPYYNTKEIICEDTGVQSSSSGMENSAESKIAITAFPYPFSSPRTQPPSSSQDNIVKGGDLQQPQNSVGVSPITSPKLPSVSKILSATMPEEQAKALKRWEEKMIAQMGLEGFRQYKESILTNGKMLHSNIESYLRGTPLEEITVAEPNQGHWNSLSGVLSSVEHVHVLESHVVHPELQYCGVIDCVAEFRNRLVLIDWKTSQKPKPFVSMTYDTPIQIAAYIGAINYDPRYSMKIDDGLIVVAYQDGSICQTFLLSSKDVGKYWKLWLNRLKFFRKINTPV